MRTPTLANLAWWVSNVGHYSRFMAALNDPRAAQERILFRYLLDNADTAFGRRHGFTLIRSVADYQARVPLSTYDDFAPYVDRIRAGEAGVLTREPVRRLVPSSGSTRAEKLIPYTDTLAREFRRGIGPWVFDLYRRDPKLLGGRAYWSVSPAAQRSQAESKVPIGFDDDSAYVGGFAKRLVDAALAVPGDVRHSPDIDSFRRATLLHLLRARDLRLVSVWHPSFLLLLLEALKPNWDSLIGEGARRGDRRRSHELARLRPDDYAGIWPNLRLISCWADAHAATYVGQIRRAFPGVRVQGKGLVATECFATLPFGDADDKPLAVRSHFFEFLDDDGTARLAHELDRGGTYSLVVTTGGGLCRYRMHDRVRVESFVGRTPALRFLGKEDHVSDRFGEKLDEGFVGGVLSKLSWAGEPRFLFLAPDDGGDDAATARYTLFVERPDPRNNALGELAPSLDRALCENPHYAYCRDLGQLGPPRVFRIQCDGYESFVRECARRGRRIGDVKPSPLSNVSGWSRVFRGEYL